MTFDVVGACGLRKLGQWAGFGVFIAVWLGQLSSLPSQEPIEPIQPLIRQLQIAPSGSRIDAATRLARQGQRATEASEALIECLTDSASDLRLVSAFALGCVQTEPGKALEALIPLLADGDEHVRYSAQWSIARIAKSLTSDVSSATRGALIALLETAAQKFAKMEHQSRHAIALEIALAKLEHRSIERDGEPSSDPTAQTKTSADDFSFLIRLPTDAAKSNSTSGNATNDNDPTTEAARIRAAFYMARTAYAASDYLSRLQFVDRLTEAEVFPDELRQIVIEVECEEAGEQVLPYALARWGELGKRALTQLVNQLPPGKMAVDSDARLLDWVRAEDVEMVERMMLLANDVNQPVVVREAAVKAIFRGQPASNETLQRLSHLLNVQKSDEGLRVAVVEGFAELQGEAAAAAIPHLLIALRSSHETLYRLSIIQALARVGANSPAAAQAISTALERTSVDDAVYQDLLDAAGAFGELGVGCVPQLVAAMQHVESSIRQSAAEALGRIGPGAASSLPTLVAHIANTREEVAVKSRAATAIRQIGSGGVSMLAARLQSADDDVIREHLLQALAIAAPSADESETSSTLAAMMTVVANEQCPAAIRGAAASTIGSMEGRGQPAFDRLALYSKPGQSDLLRSACLIATARIAPQQARANVLGHMDDKSLLIEASAAYALHLCGESRPAFEKLISLFDGSDTDMIIEQTLTDFGPVIEPWLVEVACDTSAAIERRQPCCGLACDVAQPVWEKLLPLVDDPSDADALAVTMTAHWVSTPETVNSLMSVVHEHSFTPAAQARIASLLNPDGLGAADDEDDWRGLTLTRPSSTAALMAARETQTSEIIITRKGRAVTASAVGVANESTQFPTVVTPLLEKRTATGEPVRPAVAVRATGAAVEAAAPQNGPRVVDVYYGTNRDQKTVDRTSRDLAAGVLATVAGCLLVMFFCLVGFLRHGNPIFAAVALLAIGILGPFGFYAADKLSSANHVAKVAYGANVSEEVQLGICQVSIPPNHTPGMLEAPSLLKMQIVSDPNQHVVLTDVEQLSPDQFYASLHTTLDRKGKNLLVFVHGYNVSFEDAARRTGQMSADLQFPGAPVFFSWPSQANWYGYATDKENIELSVSQIKTFLLDLAAYSGADSINLVAHSMGNVGLTEALKEMDSNADKPLFNQVVLAAPDIDADIFKRRIAPHIINKAKNVTLYTSQADLALIASRYFNHGPRVGDSGGGVLLFPGINTIDATAVDSSLLGHSYYGSNVSVLSDLGLVLANHPIANRRYLRSVADGENAYWAFDPIRVSQVESIQTQR